MSVKHDYEVRLNWLAGRMGVLSSPGLEETIAVVTPPEFPGGLSGAWSPEHLFVASISGCFMTTFLAVAENSKLSFKRFSCSATGTLQMEDGKYIITDVMLKPHVVLADQQDRNRALKVLEKAEQHCLITNSIKSRIHFDPQLEIESTVCSA